MPTIHTDETTHSELKGYCTRNGISQGDFVRFALGYFKRSGIDPSSPPESVKGELAKIDKRISQLIAFQKTFEQKQLLPLIESLYKIEAEIREQQGGGESARILEVLKLMSQQLALLNPTAAKPQGVPQGERERQLSKERYELKQELADQLNRVRYILSKLKEQKGGIMGKALIVADLDTAEVNRLWEEVKAAEIRAKQY